MIDGELSHYRAVVSTDLDSVFYSAKAAGEVFRRQYQTGLDAMGEKLQNYSYGSFIATSSMSGHIANIPQLQAAVSKDDICVLARFHAHLQFSTTLRKQVSDTSADHSPLSGSSLPESIPFHQATSPPKYPTSFHPRPKPSGAPRFPWVEKANQLN